MNTKLIIYVMDKKISDNMAENIHTVRLLNKIYKIKCTEANSSLLEEAANKLNSLWQSQRKNTRHFDDTSTLLMTALEIAYENVHLQQQQAKQQQQMKEFIEALETKIHRVSSFDATKMMSNDVLSIEE